MLTKTAPRLFLPRAAAAWRPAHAAVKPPAAAGSAGWVRCSSAWHGSTLRWKPAVPSASTIGRGAGAAEGSPSLAKSFEERFFEDDNVLFLYAIQRALLAPEVDEQMQLRDGLQHVQMQWEIQGQLHHGRGAARSKKAARREAAKKLLRALPISAEAAGQMRRQMLNGMRMRLGAELVSDAPVLSRRGQEHSHRISWRVQQVRGRPPLDLSASGAGASAEEAQANAIESLYCQALRLSNSGHTANERERTKLQTQARMQEANAGRKAQVGERLSVLSAEAAGDLAARHNAVVQQHRLQWRESFLEHTSGYHCTLKWSWRDDHGTARQESSSGLGISKKVARGDAMLKMLVSQGYIEDVTPETFNQAARIRALAKGGDQSTGKAAATFLENHPPSLWSLVLLDVWQAALAAADTTSIRTLGDAMRAKLSTPDSDAAELGLSARLWEQLLDACALVASGEIASLGLRVLSKLSIATEDFPSALYRDYFYHFRRLLAWERVGQNQSAIQEIHELGSRVAGGVPLKQDQCIFPYLTVTAKDDFGDSAVLFAEIRAGDIVYLQCRTEQLGIGHLAVVSSVTSPSASSSVRRRKLTLRCSTLGTADLQSDTFCLYGLDSEVTALRMVEALRELTQPLALLDGTASGMIHGFDKEMRSRLVESFQGKTEEMEAAEVQRLPRMASPTIPLLPSEDVENRKRCLALVEEAASARGAPMTSAQNVAVWHALEQPLTLIHGPPGTGKTTAAVCVVMAWRPSGEKILCAADSNVAADHLHNSLLKWGIKSLRFRLNEPGAEGRWARRGGAHEAVRGKAEAAYLAMRSAVADFQIVVTTCSGAGHELLKTVAFPRVLIDECTQSVEPSSLIPLSHRCARLVLIGDHKQLPPTVVAEKAQREGLEQSLFARLAKSDLVEPVLLDQQRRMHPSIAAFPNLHFYEGRVIDAAPNRSPVPGLPWACGGDMRVLLADTSSCSSADVGRNSEEREGTSWHNTGEVEAVVEIMIRALSAGCGPGAAVSPEEIAVITPYQRQKELLQNEFAQRASQGAQSSRGTAEVAALALLQHVRVSTVDGFQGAECDLVVFSAVRSNQTGHLGFLRDERRANVLLTRARRGLVVVADAATMRQASDSIWASWLAWVEAKGAIVPVSNFYTGAS